MFKRNTTTSALVRFVQWKTKSKQWNPGTYISKILNHCRTFPRVEQLYHCIWATWSMYIVVDVLRNSEPFFVETDKKTTRCYFLGFIFAYVTYWMKYRGLKYGVDIYHRHTCSTFIRSKVALYLKWYSYTLSIPIKTPSFIFYWLNFSLISFYSIFFSILTTQFKNEEEVIDRKSTNWAFATGIYIQVANEKRTKITRRQNNSINS